MFTSSPSFPNPSFKSHLLHEILLIPQSTGISPFWTVVPSDLPTPSPSNTSLSVSPVSYRRESTMRLCLLHLFRSQPTARSSDSGYRPPTGTKFVKLLDSTLSKCLESAHSFFSSQMNCELVWRPVPGSSCVFLVGINNALLNE